MPPFSFLQRKQCSLCTLFTLIYRIENKVFHMYRKIHILLFILVHFIKM